MKVQSLLLSIIFIIISLRISNAQSSLSQTRLSAYKIIKKDSSNFHSSLRDNDREFMNVLQYDNSSLVDTTKRKLLVRKLLYQHLLQSYKKDYSIMVDFLPDFLGGKTLTSHRTLSLNTRGIVAQGTLGKNVYFYSDFYENQGIFPEYLDTFIRQQTVVPGQGMARDFHKKGFDYSSSSALISYDASSYFNFQLGYGKNFIGDGYRSMLLSDNSFNYPFLKVTAGTSRIKYMAMWAQFIDLKSPSFSYQNGLRKKWGVFHYLDWNVTKKFTAGFFESVIWQDADSTGKRGFDPSYLSPILFLRPVEFSNGSPDNALMGINLKYAFNCNFILYGQFILDDFKVHDFLANKGYWNNKYGWQLGFRYFNVLTIKKLNMLAEVNSARPYTYSERSTLTNYGHYNQPLAHPLGGNFREAVTIIDYSYKRLLFRAEFLYAFYGSNGPGISNSGKDIFQSYNTRNADQGIYIGNGVPTHLYYFTPQISFLINPKYNLRLEASYTLRKENNSLSNKTDSFITIGLRSTFRNFYYDF